MSKKPVLSTKQQKELAELWFSSTLEIPVDANDIAEVFGITAPTVRYYVKKFVKSTNFNPDTMVHFHYRGHSSDNSRKVPMITRYSKDGNSTTTVFQKESKIKNVTSKKETVQTRLSLFDIDFEYSIVKINTNNKIIYSFAEIINNIRKEKSNFKDYLSSFRDDTIYVITVSQCDTVIYTQFIKAGLESGKNIIISSENNIFALSENSDKILDLSKLFYVSDENLISEGIFGYGINSSEIKEKDEGYILKIVKEKSETINHDRTIDKDYKGAWVIVKDRDIIINMFSSIFKHIDDKNDTSINACIMKYKIVDGEFKFTKTLARI